MDKIQKLKRVAKKIKREQGITHSQALDLIAAQFGYLNWALLMKDNGKTVRTLPDRNSIL